VTWNKSRGVDAQECGNLFSVVISVKSQARIRAAGERVQDTR